MSENHVTPGDTLQALYDSEINFSLTTFWDTGFAWKLGDELNGYKDEGESETIDAAASMLALAARKHFPESAFAKGTAKKTAEKAHSHERKPAA